MLLAHVSTHAWSRDMFRYMYNADKSRGAIDQYGWLHRYGCAMLFSRPLGTLLYFMRVLATAHDCLSLASLDLTLLTPWQWRPGLRG